MYNITRLYKEQRNKIDVYKPEEITPAEFVADLNINTKLYISVADDNNKNIALDYGRMFTDYEVTEVTTWEDLNTILTDALVIGYTVELPGYVPGTIIPKNPIKIWDAMSSLNTFNLDYCDYRSGRSNVFALRWHLKDLGISIMDNALSYPNLRKCIPIVNGFTCRPIYREEDKKLYALNGSQLCWYSGLHTTPEVQLLDFTDFGDVVVKPLGNYYRQGTDYVRCTCDDGEYNFSFDSNYSLYEWSPILVIAGMMIFPDEYVVKSEHKFSINLAKFPLNKCLGLMKFLKNEPNNDSGVAFASLTVKSYFTNEIDKLISADTFVIFVKTPNLCVTRTKLTSWRYNITVDLNTNEGLLLNDATHTVRNYHKDTLPDRKELTIQSYENIFIADNLYDEEQVTFVKPDCNHHLFEDLNRSSNTMVSLLGGN